MSKVVDFIDLLMTQVNKGIYVWGANGEDLNAMSNPLAWIRSKETSTSDADRAIHLYETRKKNGVDPLRAFDCSGLMYWAGKQIDVFSKDISSRGIWALCKSIEASELKAGDFIFRTDDKGVVRHVGMYIGNNQYIDDAGRDIGVRKDKFSASKWDLFGRYSKLSDDEPEPQPVPPEPEPPVPTTQYVHPKGNVRVREGNGTNYPQIKPTANKSCYLPLLGRATDAPCWYIVEWQGRTGYISDNPKYTEVVDRAD